MKSHEQKRLTKWRETHGYGKQADSCQRGRDWGLGEKGERIKQGKNKIHTGNIMVIARGKRV